MFNRRKIVIQVSNNMGGGGGGVNDGIHFIFGSTVPLRWKGCDFILVTLGIWENHMGEKASSLF